MSRLPVSGGDDGTWGDVLNDFLSQEHNTDGSQKTLDIAKGGTGATDAATARANLGAVSSSDSRLSDSRPMAAPSGSVSFNNQKAVSLADPTDPQDAATKNYVDTTAASGSVAWGGITGTLSNQTDLQTALNTKATDAAVVHIAGTETITGSKTFSVAPAFSAISNTGTLTLPTSTDTLVGRATTDTLTNKTISGSTNTFSNIPESAVTNLTSDLSAKINSSTVTTKGDILAATASATLSRLGIGGDGLVLTADSTQTTGLRWGTSSSTDSNAVHHGDLLLNVKDYGAVGDGSTDDSTAINNALAAANSGSGTIVYFPKGIYLVNQPLIFYELTMIVGAGWGSDSSDMTTIRLGNGASGATWNKYGVLTSQKATLTTAAAGKSTIIRDLKIDGNNSTNGNGIVLMNAESVVENVRIVNFNGTTANSDGYCIWLSGTTIPNGNTLATNCVATNLRNLRLESNNSRVYTNDSGSIYTDAILTNIVSVIQPTTSNIPDFDINHAAGWSIDRVHTNGSGGEGLRLRSVFNTTVTNCYLDGWGLGNTSGTTQCLRVDNFGTGGGNTSDIIIANNRFKGRSTMTSTGVYNAIGIIPSANLGKVTISSNILYTETTTGTVNFLHMAGSATSVVGAVTGNELDLSQASAGAPFASAQSNDALNFTGNNWNFGSAAPTAGWWPLGFVVWNNAPAAAGVPGWVCTAAGTPGTWKAMASLAA